MRINWPLLSNALLGQFLVGLAVSAFAVSLPTIAHALGPDISAMAWALIAFQIPLIGLSIIFGRLGDIYGHQMVSGLGFIVLTIGSFLCGISQNILQLILFRLIMGVGTAMIISNGRILALDAMPAGAEGKAQSYIYMASVSGLFFGPSMGGLIIEYIHWRAVFFFLCFTGLLGTMLRSKGAKEKSEPLSSAARSSLDYLGAGLLVLLTVLLTLLLDHKVAERIGLRQPGLWMLALTFAGMLGGFLVHENRTQNPMIHLPVFKIRMLTLSLGSLLIVHGITGLVGFIMPFYLQGILGLRPSLMGTMFLVQAVFTIPFSMVGGSMSDRMGPRIPATLGILATLIAVSIGTHLRANSSWIVPMTMLGLVGLGNGFFSPSNQAAVLGSVPKEHRGLANGMIPTMIQLGQMLGTSFGAFLLSWGFRYYSGNSGLPLSTTNPIPFVFAMHCNYMTAIVLCMIALLTSYMRGGRSSDARANSA